MQALLLLVLLALAQAQSTPLESIYVEKTQCTFCYTSSPNFQFQFCTLSHDWNTCVQQCCPNMPKYYDLSTPNIFTLNICRDYNNNKTNTIITIILVTLVCVFTLIVLICCCFTIFKMCKHLNNSNRVADLIQPITTVEWENELQINHSHCNIKWSPNSDSSKPLPNSHNPCSICLEEDTNAELICKHQYHAKCIGAWMKKNSCCPCCRRENILGIKVYCEQCKWMYMMCSRFALICYSGQLPEKCQNCLKGKEILNSSLQQLCPNSSEVNIANEMMGSQTILPQSNSLIFQDLN